MKTHACLEDLPAGAAKGLKVGVRRHTIALGSKQYTACNTEYSVLNRSNKDRL